jgi:hypothetical protein
MKILKSNRPIDEKTARALIAIEVSASVDELLADRISLGQIRTKLDKLPDDVREHYELAFFQEVGRRHHAGAAPWHLVTFFAPSWLQQGVN